MTTEATQGRFAGLGDLLARDLSTVEDLPVFVAPPPGVYKLMIEECKEKDLNEKRVLAVDYVVLEVIEIHDQGDAEEAAKIRMGKDKMSETFYFDKPDRIETTLSVLKQKFGLLGATLGTTNLLEILDKMKGMTVRANLSRRKDKDDVTKFYPQTKTIVAEA